MRTRSFLTGPTIACLALSVLALSVATPNAALAAAGGLDATFGADGIVITGFGGPAMAYGEALQPDGKILAAGFAAVNGDYQFALARYTRRGALDPRFGAGGTVRTGFGAAGSYDVGRAVALQSDGRIVVAGGSTAAGPMGFALARYNPDGTLDNTFGAGGRVLTPNAGTAYALAIQPDGSVIAAGVADAGAATDIELVRYTPNGAVDTAFGAGGHVRADLGGNENATAVALTPGGRILVAGTTDANGSRDFALLRYTSAGTPDTGFGAAGTVLTDFSGAGSDDEARALALTPSGQILLAGGSDAAAAGRHDFAIARYTASGVPVASFGSKGRVLTDFGGGDDVLALAVRADGKFVAVGGTTRIAARFALARYAPNGSLDATFGTGGTVTTDVASGGDADAFAVALQPGGRIVTAGYAGRSSFALARYLP